MASIMSENLELVQMCLELLDSQEEGHKFFAVQEEEFGWSALHFAVQTKNVDIVKCLWRPDLGIHNVINLVDKEGRTAIHLAERNTIIDKFLRYETGIMGIKQVKKELKLVVPWQKSDLTRAVIKGSHDQVEKILQGGANPDTTQGELYNWTPLMHTSHKGRADIAELLLKYNADPNKQSSDEGWTALILASYRGFVDAVKVLLSKEFKHRCNVNIQSIKRKMTALQRVCLYSRKRYLVTRYKESAPDIRGEVVRLLLDNGADITIIDSQKRTPLIAASRNGFTDVVKHILENLAEKYSTDKQKEVLDHGMHGRWTALMEASEEGYTDIAKLLLEAGATANKAKKDLVTALHIAADHGREGVVNVLLQHMDIKDINLQDKSGMTALMMAAKSKRTEVVKKLLEAGADPRIQSARKRTALQYARGVGRGSKDVVSILEEWLSTHPERSQITTVL